jgi:hypothetical protein
MTGALVEYIQAVLQRSWKGFGVVLADFFVSGLSAAVVNSALKYLTNSITVAFRQRLTQCVPQPPSLPVRELSPLDSQQTSSLDGVGADAGTSMTSILKTTTTTRQRCCG